MLKIKEVELVVMTPDEVVKYNETHVDHLFDDNGAEADGDLYLLPKDEVEGEFETIKGYEIAGYTENANYTNFTGFSSRDVIYTFDYKTATAARNG